MNSSIKVGKEKFEKVFYYSQDPIFIIHPRGDKILDANPAASKLLGYSHNELLCTRISTIHPEEMPELIAFASQVLRDGEGWTNKLSCKTKQGYKLSVEMSATNIKIEDLDCLLVIARDISKRIEAEKELKRKVKFEELVSSISSKFLQVKTTNLDSLIESTIRQLGEFSKVDRCYIYQDINHNDHFINTAEWLTEGFDDLMDTQNSLDHKVFQWIHDQLKSFETVHIPSINKIPDTEEQLKISLHKMGIKSCLVVPLNNRSKLIGFIGFDSLTKAKIWEEEDIRLLKVVSEIIVNAVARKKYDDDLRSVNDELMNLNTALEMKIHERAQEIVSQREKLTNYAYYNAHKLRAPLARLLGLVGLISKDYLKPNELPSVIEKIQEAGGELDEIVKEINEIVS